MEDLVSGLADVVRDRIKGHGFEAVIVVYRGGAEHDVRQMAVVGTDKASTPLVLNTVGEHFGSRRLNHALGAAFVPFFRMADRVINGGLLKVRTEVNGAKERTDDAIVLEVAEDDGRALLRIGHFRQLADVVTAEERRFILDQKDHLERLQLERLAG